MARGRCESHLRRQVGPKRRGLMYNVQRLLIIAKHKPRKGANPDNFTPKRTLKDSAGVTGGGKPGETKVCKTRIGTGEQAPMK